MRMATRTLIIPVVALLLAACQTTTIRSAWYDPGFTGGAMKKIAVVGVGASPTNGRVFEDIFAQRLRDAGVEGVAGYKVIPEAARMADDAFTEAVTRSGVQGVLIVRLLGVDTRTNVSTTMMPVGGSFRGGRWRGSHWGGHTMVPVTDIQQYELATVEVSLYEAATGRLVWAATTQTFNPSSVQREAPRFADIIIRQLAARGLIPGAAG